MRLFRFQAVNFSNSSIIIRKINLHQFINNFIVMQRLLNTYIHHNIHTVILLLLNCLLSTMHGSRQGYTLHWMGRYCQLGATIFSPWFRREMSVCFTSWFTVNCGVKWRYVTATDSASWISWRYALLKWTRPSLWTLHLKQAARDQ